MSVIVPAILVSTQRELKEKLAMLSGLTEDVQIDVVDGVLAPFLTWPYESVNDVSEFEKTVLRGDVFLHSGDLRIEADLMVDNIENVIEAWIALGASRVTLHTKNKQELPELLEKISKQLGYEKGFTTDMLSIGVAVGPGDSFFIIEPLLNKIDYVQFMGIRHIGKQGEPFDESVLLGVQELHYKYPEMEIQVDGGVSLTIAPKLLSAGASRLVIGSAIWYSADVKARVREFQEIASRFGRYT